jgi:hypothetical protein
MNRVIRALEHGQAAADFRGFDAAAKAWALWALDNLRGDALRKAIDISVAVCAFASEMNDGAREPLVHVWPTGSNVCARCGGRADSPVASEACRGYADGAS